MKKWMTCLLLLASLPLWGQKQYTDAQDLTFCGKIFNTTRPYERIDPLEEMTDGEKGQAKLPCGLMVAFNTDSRAIGVRVVWAATAPNGGLYGPIAARGFDLYMKKDGKWRWAGNGYPKQTAPGEPYEITLIPSTIDGEKECLLYLSLIAKIESLEIVTDKGSRIEPGPAPFKGRIAVFGSSFTQGSGAGRCAMTWEAQLSRATGYNFMNFGFSGNSKLQSYFAEALATADVDAYVFDAFSNPSPEQVEERLEPFIRTIRKAKPGIPMIFIQTIDREKSSFNPAHLAKVNGRKQTADRLMRKMTKKYKDVYWVTSTSATSEEHDATSDGSHPDSYGYLLWMKSVKDPIMEILSHYEIR